MTEFIYFRKCILGESVINNMCVGCNRGFYTYNSSANGCQKCFAHGVCNGKDDIGVEAGYWRTSNMTSNAFLCPEPKACL